MSFTLARFADFQSRITAFKKTVMTTIPPIMEVCKLKLDSKPVSIALTFTSFIHEIGVRMQRPVSGRDAWSLGMDQNVDSNSVFNKKIAIR